MVRPLVLCAIPEEAWYELIPESELHINDDLFSGYEWELKKRIYRWEHIKDDEIISDKLYVPICYRLTDWIDGRIRRQYYGASSCLSSAHTAHLPMHRFPPARG